MYLLTGPEELLLRRAADKVVADVADGGEVEVVDLRGPDLKDDGLPDLRTGSLFGTPRVVLVRQAQDLPAAISDALLAELAGPPPETPVVLLATGTGSILKLAKRIKELGGRVDVAPPRDWEDAQWARLVDDELARHGRSADRRAVAALLGHAGLDVSAIAEKVAQVVAAVPTGQITAAHVEQIVVGHGSRGSFAVADAMCDRNPAEAVTLLRGVLEAGDHPIMVLGALSYRLRSLVAVAGGVDPKSVGLNISPGQARRLQGVRRNFGPGELTRAYRTLADADVALKSGDLPPALVIERAVLDVATRA
jgi:DNA polymerase III subunit delta